MSTTIRSRVLGPAALLSAAALALAGCSSDGGENDQNQGAGQSAGAGQITVTLTSGDGGDVCTPDATETQAGPTTFTVKNESAAGISEVELLKDERIVGEKENLAPGLDPVAFTVTLDGGGYQIYCPGAAQTYQDFTVTGQAATTPSGSVQTILADGSKDYAGYVKDQIGQLQTTAGELDSAVQSGDVEASKQAYAKARPYYERAESNVEGFVKDGFKAEDNEGNLDYLVDMRASNLDPEVGWHGFHAIERDLWKDGRITDSTKKQSAELKTNVGLLVDVVDGLEYRPEDLANGAAALLEEVQTNKISGEEEQFSHLDLVDFAANVEGAQQAYAALRPGLQKIDGDLVAKIDAEFKDVLKALDGYRDADALGGYQTYDAALKKRDSAKLTKSIQPLHDALASIAEKVATA